MLPFARRSNPPSQTTMELRSDRLSVDALSGPLHTRVVTRFATTLLLTILATFPLTAWKNGGKSAGLANPKFGTHDYIALQGLRRASPPRSRG